jgi:DNA-binding NarL/FixJ family response regulator
MNRLALAEIHEGFSPEPDIRAIFDAEDASSEPRRRTPENEPNGPNRAGMPIWTTRLRAKARSRLETYLDRRGNFFLNLALPPSNLVSRNVKSQRRRVWAPTFAVLKASFINAARLIMRDHDSNPAFCPKVYIVSDVRLYREGIIQYINLHSGLRALGGGSSAEALAHIGSLNPDSLLVDVGARETLGLPSKAKAIVPDLRIVGYAVSEIDSNVLACARAGMSGYVGKDASLDDLVNAVLCAMKNELMCSPRITALLFSRLAAGQLVEEGEAKTESLTLREAEVSQLVAHGLANKGIARKLQLSNATVKNHVHHILLKLKLLRRSQIASVLATQVSNESVLMENRQRRSQPSVI